MSLIGTAIGALVALVARPKKPYVSNDPLIAFTVMLERGIARRDRQIEALERDLATERQLCAHWRETAQAIARQSREAREAQIGWQQHDALVQQAQAQYALAQQAQYQAQAGLQQNQYAAQQNGFEGLCNCVPSRAQMWGAQHGLVQRLNDRSD